MSSYGKLVVSRLERGRYGIIPGYYSKALTEACQAVPGMRYDRELGRNGGWYGYADAIECARENLSARGITLEGETHKPDSWKTGLLTIPVASTGRGNLKLREYQKEGVKFLVARATEGCLLADGMRLGKSATAAIAARAFDEKTLIVCPPQVAGVWGRAPDHIRPGEIAKWWPDAWRGLDDKPYLALPKKAPKGVVILEGVEPNKYQEKFRKLSEVKEEKRTPAQVKELKEANAILQDFLKELQNAKVVIANSAIVYAWEEIILRWGLRTLICDEIHDYSSWDTRRSIAVKAIADVAVRRLGLSVGPNTPVLTRHFGTIQRLAISELHNAWVCDKTGWEVRAFDGQKFIWAPLKKSIAHSPKKTPVYEIKTSYGRALTLTADHSVYKVVRGNKINSKQYEPVLECARGEMVRKGDFLLLEQGGDTQAISGDRIDLAQFVQKSRPYLIMKDKIAPAATQPHRPFKMTQKDAKHARAMQKAGASLKDIGKRFGVGRHTVAFALKRKNWAPPASVVVDRIAGRSRWANRFIDTSAIAYLIGLFVGDGWLDGMRFNISVAKKDLVEWQRTTAPLFKTLGAVPKIRNMPRGSVEARMSSAILVDFTKAIGCAAPAHLKRLPSLFAWHNSKTVVESLIRGLEHSDGHRKVITEKNSQRIYYTTTSKELAFDVMECLRHYGIVASLSTKPPKPGGVVNGKQINGKKKGYIVSWSPLKRSGHVGSGRHPIQFAQGRFDGLPVQVRSVRKVKSPQLVYDLQVEGTYNFVAGGLLAHNSGTPMLNRPRDLHNVINILCPGRMGVFFREEGSSYAKLFCDSHQKTVGNGPEAKTVWDHNGKSNLDLLKRRLSYMMFRRVAKEVDSQLPAKQRQIVDVKITASKMAMPTQEILKNKAHLRRVLDLAADGKLAQVIALVKSHVEAGEKVLVFCHRQHFAEAIADGLTSFQDDCGVTFVHGGVGRKESDKRIEKAFQHEGPFVFACTIESCSTGIDLSFASVVIFAELTWEPAELAQAEDRTFVLGSGRKTFYQYVIARGTGDELILQSVISKLDDFEQVVGKTGDNMKTDLERKRSREDALKALGQALMKMNKKEEERSL